MIASLTGTLTIKLPTEININVQGVGYQVNIPLSTYEKLGEIGSTVTVLTYLHVREDALQLYGFSTDEERTFFRMLISVSGIGPKIAQAILSGISVSELRHHIITGNVSALTRIPGIGRKTAERLVVELKEKVAKVEPEVAYIAGVGGIEIRSEALLALTSLGFNRAVAEKAIRSALAESNGKELSIEELIKKALRYTA
jgi:Holliday junction DNA helicase RuvA